MIAPPSLLVLAALALGTLLGYAVPRPEAQLEAASDVASRPAAECPKVDTSEADRLRRQVAALEKDVALRDARLEAAAPAAKAPQLAQAAPAPPEKKAGWGRDGDAAQKAAWAVPAENFQSW